MENFIEAYGAFQNKMLFVAVRFQKPIVKVQITEEDTAKIDTSNILVVQAKKLVTMPETNTLTFFVGNKKHSDGISIKTASESEMLLTLLDKSKIYYCSYHNSVLYVCGALNCVPFPYTRIPKTATFNALYRISKACQKGKINIDQFVLCSYFKRNNLKWQNWKSWWCFVRDIMNDAYKAKVSKNISLQMVKYLKRVWKNSCRQKNAYNIHPELIFCEITFEKSEQPGVLCQSNHSMIIYVSPMIVSFECIDFLPIVDKANVKCDRWFPLYTNKHNWFEHLIYFYVKQLRVNIENIKRILFFLKDTTVVKYKLIQENFSFIYRLLTCDS